MSCETVPRALLFAPWRRNDLKLRIGIASALKDMKLYLLFVLPSATVVSRRNLAGWCNDFTACDRQGQLYRRYQETGWSHYFALTYYIYRLFSFTQGTGMRSIACFAAYAGVRRGPMERNQTNG